MHHAEPFPLILVNTECSWSTWCSFFFLDGSVNASAVYTAQCIWTDFSLQSFRSYQMIAQVFFSLHKYYANDYSGHAIFIFYSSTDS
jgi:hypothetical protein